MFRQSLQRKQIPKLPSLVPDSQAATQPSTQQPLLDSVISYVRLTVKQKEDTSKMVQSMGGQMQAELTENVAYLIAGEAGPNEYKVAYQLRIPILKPGWIEHIYDLWTKGRPIDIEKAMEDFVMGPLSGCGICVTGISTETRLEIEKGTNRLGGKYTQDMLKATTTHLICGQPSGQKYISAIRWGTVKCVPIEWFKDTVVTFELADVSKYTFTANNHRRIKDPDTSKASNGDRDANEPAVVVRDKMYLEACHIYLCPSIPACQVVQCKKMIRVAGGIQVVEYDPMEVTHVLVPSSELEPSTSELFSHDAPLPYIVSLEWLWRSNKIGKVMPEADFAVFPLAQSDNPNRMEDSAGLSNGTARDKPKDIANVRSKKSTANAPASSSTDTKSDEEGNPSTGSSDRMSALPESNTSQVARRGLRTRTVSGMLSEALDDLTMSSATMGSLQTQENSLQLIEEVEVPQLDIFLGLYITSHGCKESVAETIREQTVACGGTYFEDHETLPSGANARIIVPLSTPMDDVKSLKGVVLTSCWFERSLIEQKVISRNDHFLFRPMKSIPIKGFEELCISVSSNNMKEVEYTQIGRAIKILGATFLNKLNSARTNLLISDFASGPKYEFMVNSGRPVVRMDWLKQCIEEGVRLPFKGYLLNEDTVESKESLGSSNSLNRKSSSEGQQSNESISQVRCTQQAVPSDTPLEGLTICLPRRVIGDHKEMQDMIVRMGARYVASYNSSATHLIHKGKATQDVMRSIRNARKDKIIVVSPDWLYKCMETGLRVDERDYPETYDKQTTLTIAHTQPHSDSRVQSTLSPSPSLNSPGIPGMGNHMRSPSAKLGGPSTPVGQHYRYSTNAPSPSQRYQGTAAGATSSLFGGESEQSFVNMVSTNNSSEVTLPGTMDTHPHDRSAILDMDSIWESEPAIPVTRSSSSRKRRRAQTAPESSSTMEVESKDIPTTGETQQDSNDGWVIPENYFDKAPNRYGDDAVYWVDVEGREKKRALLESLGYKTFKPLGVEPTPQDQGIETLAQELQRPCKYFLLSGLTLLDRKSIKKTVRDLGGVVLEDISEDHDDWKKKCTHLITNGNNPPRTAKFVIAKSCKAFIVSKAFMFASAAEGAYVDETPYRVQP
ncbi:hypothetical protein B0O80DRAFT_40320 [Mortierella sp. GBAus27b]|nr:hypothetical protein B0O80DRAFT_40320 [Mortierella sp. GBAus27b]